MPYDNNSTYCSETYPSKDYYNKTHPEANPSCQEDFYNTQVLVDSNDFFQGLTSIQWHIFGCLLVAWAIVYYGQSRSAKTVGKLSYITAILPYFCLTSLLIVTFQQKGAFSVGLRTYMTIDFEYLFDPSMTIWIRAAEQIFYSQGVVWGVLVVFSSHNKFKFDIFRHNFRLSCINAASSLYGSLIIFATLGMLAYDRFEGDENMAREKFGDVVGQNQKLIFILYPLALTKMPFSTIWAIIFFGMMVCLAIGSQTGMFMAYFEGILEKLSHFKYDAGKRNLFLIYSILFSIICALPMVTSAGSQWVSLYNDSLCCFSIFIFAFLEIICISWYYGIDKMILDIEKMIGGRLPFRQFWKITWKYLTFGMTIFLIGAQFKYYGSQSWLISKDWPLGMNLFGWGFIQATQIAPLFYFVYKNRGMGTQDIYFRRSRDDEEESSSSEDKIPLKF